MDFEKSLRVIIAIVSLGALFAIGYGISLQTETSEEAKKCKAAGGALVRNMGSYTYVCVKRVEYE